MHVHWGIHRGAFCFWLGHACIASLRSPQEADALAVTLLVGDRHICVEGAEGTTRYPLGNLHAARRCVRDMMAWADAQLRS